MELIVILWNEVIIRPMLNTLVVLYVISSNQMGIAIILLTVVVRAITMPLTLKQIRQMRVMSTLQPKMREIQNRYSGDRARASQETMRLYREAGVNPIGCLGPLVVQMPILIGLFRVLIQTVFSQPEELVGLSEKLYSWIPMVPVHAAAPLDASFLGLDLGSNPEQVAMVLIPAMVFASTWVQQKLTVSPSTDPRQQSNQTMMLWMMPIMIAFFSIQFPMGLSMYWIVSNVIGVAIQYLVTPKGELPPLFPLFPKPEAPPPSAGTAENDPPKETGENGSTRNDGSNRRRSNRASTERARRRPRRGRGRNTK